MLYIFRKPYNEAVTGIPVNGGTYNLMLNTVSKKIAGLVACLSFLSYLATAIVSAFAAVIFLSELWSDCGNLYLCIECFLFDFFDRYTVIYCTYSSFLWYTHNLWGERICCSYALHVCSTHLYVDITNYLGICVWLSG